jgi:hypothetical protein
MPSLLQTQIVLWVLVLGCQTCSNNVVEVAGIKSVGSKFGSMQKDYESLVEPPGEESNPKQVKLHVDIVQHTVTGCGAGEGNRQGGDKQQHAGASAQVQQFQGSPLLKILAPRTSPPATANLALGTHYHANRPYLPPVPQFDL